MRVFERVGERNEREAIVLWLGWFMHPFFT